MRPENKNMQDFLTDNGIPNVKVKYIWKGSMAGCWRVTGVTNAKKPKCFDDKYQKWTPELIEKLTALNFRDFDGQPLGEFSGGGGAFSVFVRGHSELKGGKTNG